MQLGGKKTVTTFDNRARQITSRRDGVATVTYIYDKRGNATCANANLFGRDEVIGYDTDSREIRRGVPIAVGAMVAGGQSVRRPRPAVSDAISAGWSACIGDSNNYERYTWNASGSLVALRKCDGQTVN